MQYITREELYERVWEEPFVRLAPKLGTSGPALKQLCLCAAIPLPGTGHWSKLRSGKIATPQPLLRRPPGASAVIVIGEPQGWWRSPREMLVEPVAPKPDFPEPLDEMAARIAGELIPLTKATPIWPPRNTPPLTRRRLQLLADLRALLAQIITQPEIVEEDPETYRVEIHRGWPRFTFRASESEPGNLSIWMDRPAGGSGEALVFTESDEATLESQLHAIAVALLVRAEAAYRAQAWSYYEGRTESRREAEKDARLRHEKAVALVNQRRLDRQQARRDRLFSQADAWRTAQDIRGFVAEVLAITPADGMTIALGEWAEWARREADDLDPVKQVRLTAPLQA